MSLIQDVAGGGVPDPVPGPPPLSRKEKGSRGLSPGASFALRKTGAALGTLLFVLVVNFFLFRMLPGDPIGMYTRGRNVPAEQLAALRAELDRPILGQFLTYLRNPFSSTIDSAQFNRPVWELVTERIWPTLLLVGTAIGWIGGFMSAPDVAKAVSDIAIGLPDLRVGMLVSGLSHLAPLLGTAIPLGVYNFTEAMSNVESAAAAAQTQAQQLADLSSQEKVNADQAAAYSQRWHQIGHCHIHQGQAMLMCPFTHCAGHHMIHQGQHEIGISHQWCHRSVSGAKHSGDAAGGAWQIGMTHTAAWARDARRPGRPSGINPWENLVRSRRLELPLRLRNSDLNAARLPIPPRPHP